MDIEAVKKLNFFKVNNKSENVQKAMRRHPKKSFDELLIELSNKGISFDKMDTFKAKEVLVDLNYYYKLTVYRRNFKKDENGKYINLDFSTLADIASVDRQLRYLLLSAVLDIEHALKTFLVTQVTDNTELDGFDIARRFFHSTLGTNFETSEEKILEKVKHKSSYQKKLYDAHKDAPPIWVLVEVMNFGEFLRLFEFYFTKYPHDSFEISKMSGVLNATKQIRNCCAHSNAFLFYLSGDSISHTNNYVEEYAKRAKIGKMYYGCTKVHDVIAVIFAHCFFVKGNGSRTHRKLELIQLADRTLERLSYIERENDIIHFFNILKKMVYLYE